VPGGPHALLRHRMPRVPSGSPRGSR
jgi:hypothetical protein